MRNSEIINILRKELEHLNKTILEHPYIRDGLDGKLTSEHIRKFVINQLYIVFHDLKSLSHLLSRSDYDNEIKFFKTALDGDYEAYNALKDLADELGIRDFRGDVDPEAVTYTHYLSYLSLYATLGDAAVALVINLPVWGENVSRLAMIFRERYEVRSIRFLEMFSGSYKEFEELSYPIIERYLDMDRYRVVARMIQCYEKMFWDAIYKS